MALFTTADRDAVKAALIEAATSGVASCTVQGHAVTGRTVDELKSLLDYIQQDLASTKNHGGMRFTQLVPGGTG
jgi:hypothetical protein